MAGMFGSVITAMVTPFKENDSSLNLERAQEIAAWLLDNGSDALVIAGTTGEGATLSDQEKIDLFRATVEAAKGKGKIIAGTGTYDTAHSVHLTEEAERAGVDGVLVVAPYYNKPPQTGLYEHFKTVAAATKLPVILYNIPGRTAIQISNETLLKLAEIDNIKGVKDATGDFTLASELIAAAPGDFELISGDDVATFALVCLGGTGVISVTSHVAGIQMSEMVALAEKGDIDGARKIHSSLLPLYRALFITSSPIPVKAAMGLIGQPVGPPRLPLVPATQDEIAAVKKALEESGVH
ncbi:MAG: 4-hydroxy-tetrahydrodipicolinate synthase [Actinomycetota bacterium]